MYRAPLPLNDIYDVGIPPKTIRENSIPLSTEYDVLITIVNPDPKTLKLDLDPRALDLNLQDFLDTVRPIANFTVKSQWLYLVDLGVTPKNYGDHFALSIEQLPHVITPLEKEIWSHMSPRPTLNLVVYLAPCRMPLYIYDEMRIKVESNAFLSPRWGGIQILNGGKEACEAGIFKPDLKRIVPIFLDQLRQLIGLKGFEEKDVLELKETKTVEMIDSTFRTLNSLAHLLSEISSIVISDEVAGKVREALENAEQADDDLDEGEVDEALAGAKRAFENSEAAFSDPSLLALLYFPDDQKYAVYIPLFLPITIPVVMSLSALKRWYNARKLKVE